MTPRPPIVNSEPSMQRVRQFFPLCLAAMLAGSLGAQTKRPMTFNDIMELRNVGGVALSPDGNTVAYTVSTWEHPNAKPAPNASTPDTAKGDRHEVRSHIWLVSASGGTPRQITFSE